jgi:hypothetical protein
MHQIKTVLTRIPLKENQGKQTLGTMAVYDGINKIYETKTLELPWKENKRKISCIPDGDYFVRKRLASESGSRDYDHFIVEDVEGRSYILWHSGNFHWHILGCILHGQSHADINKDGLLDVTNTGFTIAQLYKILPDRFPFKIITLE